MTDLSHITHQPFRRRYQRSLDFVAQPTNGDESIIDIGAPNAFSVILSKSGFSPEKAIDGNPLLQTFISRYFIVEARS